MNEIPKLITVHSIDKLLKFLLIFEQGGYEFAKRRCETDPFHYYNYSEEVIQFEQTLYNEGFIIPFDWVKWQDEAERLVSDPNALKTADLETLQKLLTTHVRKERFCEGHLAAMLREHHITAILHRLKEIREQMSDSL